MADEFQAEPPPLPLRLNDVTTEADEDNPFRLRDETPSAAQLVFGALAVSVLFVAIVSVLAWSNAPATKPFSCVSCCPGNWVPGATPPRPTAMSPTTGSSPATERERTW